MTTEKEQKSWVIKRAGTEGQKKKDDPLIFSGLRRLERGTDIEVERENERGNQSTFSSSFVRHSEKSSSSSGRFSRGYLATMF